MSINSHVELRVWEQPQVSREEVTAGMGIIISGIVENVNIRTTAMELQDDEMIAESVDALVKRSLILVNGIRRDTSSESLAGLLKRYVGFYETYSTLLDEEHVNNSFELRDKINRFGEALQGNMIVNDLLTQEAKKELQEL